MSDLTRTELEQRCQRLLADGQQVTAKVESLLQRSEPMEGSQFDRALARYRREEEEIHRQLEQAMTELQALG
jgi:hypothetical protein